MKNNILFQFIGLALLLGSLSLTSCKVEKIEEALTSPEFSLRNRTDCDLFFKGKTLDARNYGVISNAKISIDELGLKALSDENGEFCIHINIPPNEQAFFEGHKMVKISQDGHLISTLEIDFSEYYNPEDCGDILKTWIDLEILLTPRQRPLRITQEEGDWFVQDTLPAFMRRNRNQEEINEILIWLPKYSVDRDQEIAITPRNINQPLGTVDAPEGIIYRFDATPSSVVCGIPITLKFKAMRHDVTDESLLGHYFFNAETNRWEKDNAATFAIMDDGTIVLNTNCLAEHLITYRPSILIEHDTTRYVYPVERRLENCNCNEPTTYQRDYTLRNFVDETLTREGRGTEMDSRIILSDLRNTLNIPAYTTEKNYQFRNNSDQTDSNTSEILDTRTFTLGGSIGKCQTKVFFAREQYRDVSGTINGVPFTYSTIIAFDIGERVENCPTSSACHQGCSN